MLNRVFGKLSKKIVRMHVKSREKTFRNLKYYFKPCRNSKTLIVSFAGFPGKGVAAGYNYVVKLKKIKANQLFLLDDIWNPVNIGSYYLGKDGDWYLEKDVTDLIRQMKEQYTFDKVIMIGSSKGGTSALYFGIKMEADYCIIGAPQYHVGNYLSSEHLKPILQTIMGDDSQESVDQLNNYIPAEMQKNHTKKPTVYIHYSPKEHTYKDHIKDMLSDLRENGYQVIEDNGYDYEQHKDVAKYYPAYLAKTIDCVMRS